MGGPKVSSIRRFHCNGCAVSAKSYESQKLTQKLRAKYTGQGSPCSLQISVHSILEQLLKQYPCFNIKQIFNRYSLLSGKENPDAGLICSIPISIAQDKVMVNYLTLSRREDCLYSLPWTHIYSPTQADEVIGNSSACAALLQWLKCWSKKCHDKSSVTHTTIFDKNCRKKLRKKKSYDSEEDASDPDFLPGGNSHNGDLPYSIQENCEVGGDHISSAILLYGPHGSGKTAAVYACASEVGFKVFEVNAGVLRSKSQLLQKLKEVTLSQRVQPFAWATKSTSSVSLCSNTVILFDEVDIVFHGDHGFLQAIEEIISSTRCPIILTCSDSLDFHVEVLKLQFCLPSELELAIHLSLLSLANGWPLPLEHSQRLCRHFCTDIRKTMLHLQFMLSWKLTDPVGPLTLKKDSTANLTTSCSLSLNSSIYFPWRNQHSYRRNFTKLSNLDLIFVLRDRQSEVDTIQLASGLKRTEPWTVRLGPSLLDELTVSPSPCSVGKDILNTLHDSLDADCPSQDTNRKWDKQNPVKKLFSKCWQLSRAAMATEGIPFLKLMYSHEVQKRATNKTRQSRHYFHPHHLELSTYFSACTHT